MKDAFKVPARSMIVVARNFFVNDLRHDLILFIISCKIFGPYIPFKNSLIVLMKKDTLYRFICIKRFIIIRLYNELL